MTATVSITVSAVNDAPTVALPADFVVDADTTVAFSGSRTVSVGDVDAGDSGVFVTITAEHGSLSLATTEGLVLLEGDGIGDAALSFRGSVDAANGALAGLSLTPSPGYEGLVRLTLAVDDEGATGDGGAKTASGTLAIGVGSGLGSIPSVAGASFFAPTLQPIDVALSARGHDPGVAIAAIVVESCSGDTTSTLVLDGTTIDCDALPQTLPVADASADVDDGLGLAHTFEGSWTPTSASTAGFGVVVHVVDDHDPALSSASVEVAFAHHLVNTAPLVETVSGYVSGQPTFSPPASFREMSLCIVLDANYGDVTIPTRVLDPDLAPSTSPSLATDAELVAEFTGKGPEDGTVILGFADAGRWAVLEAGSRWRLVAPIDVVNQEPSAVTIAVNTATSATFDLTYTFSDLGTAGACSEAMLASCPKTTTVLFHVDTFTPTSGSPTVNPLAACPD